MVNENNATIYEIAFRDEINLFNFLIIDLHDKHISGLSLELPNLKVET